MLKNTAKVIPIISIIGYSGSGKTTLIEKLIAELRSRNISVGAVKHSKCDFDIDYEGKDSWRFAQSGADAVAIVSDEKVAFIGQSPGEELSQLASRFMEDIELVLAEGFRTESIPQILILGKKGIPTNFNKDKLIAVVGDEKTDFSVPNFHRDNIKAIADFILDFVQNNN